MRTKASGHPSWPGVTDSTQGRIHWRRPTAILRFSLATLRRTIHSGNAHVYQIWSLATSRYSSKTNVSNDLLILILRLWYSMKPSFLNLFMKKTHASARSADYFRYSLLGKGWQFVIWLVLHFSITAEHE